MLMRIGKVTSIHSSTGKVKVMYEDTNNASLPLSMIAMNKEYSMPEVGDRVVTLHMGNGSSKGFVLGTFYGGSTQPKVSSGYHKDLGGGAYVTCQNGAYLLHAGEIAIEAEELTLKCAYGTITVEELMKRLERIENVLDLPHTI